MANLWRCLRVVACVLAFTLRATAQPTNATGTLNVNDSAAGLRYAYAFHDAAAGLTRILITSAPVSAAMLAEEAALRGTDGMQTAFRDLVQKKAMVAIELFVNADGVMDTVIVFESHFDTPMVASGDETYWYEPYRMPDGWTGARSRTRTEQDFFDNKWQYDVAYFAPVGRKAFDVPSQASIEAQRKEIDEREKPRIVQPGGGEEGAMYLAFYKNLEATNTKALLQQMTAAMKKAVASEMGVATLTESDLASWAMMRSTPPARVEIVGGVRDPDGTLLELRKTGTREDFGTAKIVKEQGVWKVSEQNW